MKTIETIRSWARRIKRDAVTLWFVCLLGTMALRMAALLIHINCA
ncbi:hypothetical protein [Pollutimonas sp. M17]|nr:hypothetical protein [Pollutimonas sp. M17]UYO92338.1 hypothetical protein OEG81_10425 [Pollutimonas sp. M17]HWK69972.1 hypothetical protein [Burkholderiaceae bacterium]